jgi:putative heme transporter
MAVAVFAWLFSCYRQHRWRKLERRPPPVDGAPYVGLTRSAVTAGDLGMSDDDAAGAQPVLNDSAPAARATGEATVGAPDGRLQRLLAAGRVGWAIIGIAGAIVVIGFILGRLSLVVVPLVLALFPATLLTPLANRLKRHLPEALAASITLVAAVAAIALVIGLMVPLIAAELPRLAGTASEGMAEVARFLDEGPFGIDLGGVAGLIDQAREQLSDLGELAGPALDAATVALEIAVATVLLLVVLFFYLKDGERIGRGLLAVVPPHQRPRLRQAGEQAWLTLGAFFRGQLLIALVDAVAIGIGLALLRVPLALPLAVLVFFGGLFPIVGAITAGALAVLVALAHGGLVLGLVVLALIVAVQQLEGNVLEPWILGQVVKLPALVVVPAVAAGAITFGVLGAFLAVPITAVVGHVAGIWRETPDDHVPAHGPGAQVAGDVEPG